MLENIPLELRQLAQWVVSGKDKVPMSPRTGEAASVSNPATWGTFEEAAHTGMPFVGFVLTEADPFTIIDLDNKPEHPATPEQLARQAKIVQAFDSYTERSASGSGYHVIVKGRIPVGLHRDNIEVYSTARYMICTGNVTNNCPIAYRQDLLDILAAEMTPAATVDLDDSVESEVSDEAVVDMAMNAINGDKFTDLCNGHWQAMGYESQSEADFALLSILAFYTQDNSQVRRLFRMSALGKREKAVKNDRYIDFALRKIRAKEPPPVDLSAFQATPPSPPAPPEPEPPTPKPESLTFPPGLVGEIASYIFSTSVRPVPEIALGAAIAVVAGICGRSYNISGTGLNQYIMVLAKTGAGKEGASFGIDSLMAAVRPKVPMVDEFIGPSAFASGQALVKILDERPCFVSVLGEFGLTLQQLCDPRANAALVMLKKVLLDLYGKSGWHSMLRASVYSDKEKNTKLVQAPNVTILGEATPETFFAGLDQEHIAEGLIPRFCVIEYTGPRPPRNRKAGLPPSPELATRFTNLLVSSMATRQNNTCAGIRLESPASALLDEFDRKADALINSAGSDVDLQLWNRAHLKALKLAGLVAVGVNPANPVVTEDIASWAIKFIERDVTTVTERFKSGEVGHGDHRQEADIRSAVKKYMTLDPAGRKQYKVPEVLLTKPFIPFAYLRRKLRLLTSFKDDRLGSTKAIDNALQDLVKAEVLVEIPDRQVFQMFGLRSKLYEKGPQW